MTFRSITVFAAIIALSPMLSSAQELPSNYRGASIDNPVMQDVEKGLQDFYKVCLASYKSVTDNSSVSALKAAFDCGPILKLGYEKTATGFRKQLNDITIEAEVDLDSSQTLLTKVPSWDGSQEIEQNVPKDVPAIACIFRLTSDDFLDNSQFVNKINSIFYKYRSSLNATAMKYGLENVGHDCQYSEIRIPSLSQIFRVGEDNVSYVLKTPNEAHKKTSLLPACANGLSQTAGRRVTLSGGYQIVGKDIIHPDGHILGTIRDDNSIVNSKGRIIGRVKSDQTKNPFDY